MVTTPTDVVNEALDEIGEATIDDLFDGSPTAKVAVRLYDKMLRQMHAGAPWNFARRELQLHMLADRAGTYTNNTVVPMPWNYVYEWPADCVHFRHVLNLCAYALAEDGTPMYAATGWRAPAPFLVFSAPVPNDVESSWDRVEGHSPEETRAIATNQLGAIGIYTGLVQYPDAWDPLFYRAFVAAMAARLALPVVKDKREALGIRAQQSQVAREALIEARVRDGNEGWTVVDHTPDWIRARGAWFEDAGGVY